MHSQPHVLVHELAEEKEGSEVWKQEKKNPPLSHLDLTTPCLFNPTTLSLAIPQPVHLPQLVQVHSTEEREGSQLSREENSSPKLTHTPPSAPGAIW